MKRISLFLFLALCFSLMTGCSCGDDDDDSGGGDTTDDDTGDDDTGGNLDDDTSDDDADDDLSDDDATDDDVDDDADDDVSDDDTDCFEEATFILYYRTTEYEDQYRGWPIGVTVCPDSAFENGEGLWDQPVPENWEYRGTDITFNLGDSTVGIFPYEECKIAVKVNGVEFLTGYPFYEGGLCTKGPIDGDMYLVFN